MDKLKQWVALTLVGVLAVLAAGWFLLVSPKRHTASDLNAQATAQDTSNAGLRTQLAMLKAQAKDEPAQEAKLAKVAAKIPDNPALPALIRDLDKASAATGVDVSNLSPSAPTLVAPAAAAATTPSAARAAAVPVSGAAGSLASIPVTLSVTGSYFQVLEFVDQLEGLNRAFKVTGLTVAPGGSTATANKLTTSIAGTVYMAAGRTPLAAVIFPKPGK